MAKPYPEDLRRRVVDAVMRAPPARRSRRGPHQPCDGFFSFFAGRRRLSDNAGGRAARAAKNLKHSRGGIAGLSRHHAIHPEAVSPQSDRRCRNPR